MVDDDANIPKGGSACIPNLCQSLHFLSVKSKSNASDKAFPSSSSTYLVPYGNRRRDRRRSGKHRAEPEPVVTYADETDIPRSSSVIDIEFEGDKELYSNNQEEEDSLNMNGFQSFGHNLSNGIQGDRHSTSGMSFRDKSRRETDSFSQLKPNPTSFPKSVSRQSLTPTPSSPYKNASQRGISVGSESLHSISRNSSRRSTTPIMFSNSTGTIMKPPPIEKRLECTLEELCYGCTKKIKITRDVLTSTGQIVQKEEYLSIKVKSGWKKGTKITFEGMGNERPGMSPADITFVITEKGHALFRREGDDLELAVEIPLVKALTGCKISVPLLGGDKLDINFQDIIYPGYVKIIEGQGMPNPKDQGKRGNLHVVFLVEFPTELADKQRSEIVSILTESKG